MSDVEPSNLPQPGPSAGGERRALTADEMKQIDVMLGHGGGPTLIRRDDPSRQRGEPSGRLLRTVIVAIILLSIIAVALLLFR